MGLAPAFLGCGARTGIELETPDGSIFVPAGDNPGAGSHGNGAPGPCPACPGEVTCTGPYACLTSDGCTYGWCSTGEFATNSSVRDPQYSASGFCVASTAAYVCADPMEDPEGPVSTNCVWPPRGNPGEACIGRLSGGQSCGRVSCGSGCTCLCENVCWCGG